MNKCGHVASGCIHTIWRSTCLWNRLHLTGGISVGLLQEYDKTLVSAFMATNKLESAVTILQSLACNCWHGSLPYSVESVFPRGFVTQLITFLTQAKSRQDLNAINALVLALQRLIASHQGTFTLEENPRVCDVILEGLTSKHAVIALASSECMQALVSPDKNSAHVNYALQNCVILLREGFSGAFTSVMDVKNTKSKSTIVKMRMISITRVRCSAIN